jgi:cytochrome P450
MPKARDLWPDLDRIPHPEGRLPVVGDVRSADMQSPMQGAMATARRLGPIYHTTLPGFEMVVVSGADLVADLVDDARFAKHVGFGIDAFRPVTGDGLFTAYNDEPNWQTAHDILGPAFSKDALRSYHPTMLRTVRGLTDSWDRACGGEPVDVVGDATKLALETIGQAGFGYSFDSFARTQPHPFVAAMISTLQHSMKMPLAKVLGRKRNAADVRYLHGLVEDVIRTRRTAGDLSKQDLLGHMVNSVQPGTGRTLDVENIRNQITTFLIAGYGTSAGLLSFALHFLVKHPDVLERARREVDDVLGPNPAAEPTFDQIAKLRYVRRVLDEALRLWPPTPAFLREARVDTTVGPYRVRKGGWAVVLVPMLHRDPAWGANAEEFDPDRFAPEQVRARPAHLYKPFGTGLRACIGRQFAQHEATLSLCTLLRRYELHDVGYELTVGEGGFFMPAGFTLGLSPRDKAIRLGAA